MRRLRHPLALLAALVLVIGAGGLAYDTLSGGSSVEAAEGGGRIYWGGAGALGHRVSFANLDGSGGGASIDSSPATMWIPSGVAIDAARDRIFWANGGGTGPISYASLDGGGGVDLNSGGASVSEPHGLTLDEAAGRIYWANTGNDTISYLSLNGGGGDLNTTGASPSKPAGLAIDPAAGRIYWANQWAGISWAKLDGSGGGTLNTAGASTYQPQGVAIDSAGRRIYFSNYGSNTISWANLDGSGGADLDTSGAVVDGPYGVAVDQPAGRIYWTNHDGPSISYADIGGGGGGTLDTGFAFESPSFPTLLKPPSGSGAPTITGSRVVGSKLVCSAGIWAADLFPAHLYRTPQTFAHAWTRNGEVIAGAGGNTYVVDRSGSYGCSVTASNHAGAATQTSAAVTVPSPLALGAVKLNKKKGTGELAVTVATAGSLRLSGEWVATRNREVGSAGTVKMPVKPKGDPKQALNRKGKAVVKVTVQFKPAGGGPSLESKRVRLRKRLS